MWVCQTHDAASTLSVFCRASGSDIPMPSYGAGDFVKWIKVTVPGHFHSNTGVTSRL